MNRDAIRAELHSRKHAHASRLTLDRHAPIPLLAPCAVPGCGLLCIPVTVQPAITLLGVVVRKRNLRPRCAQHAAWLAGDKLPATGISVSSPCPGSVAADVPGEPVSIAEQAEPVEGRRSTAPLAYVAALCLLAWIAAALLKSHNESGDRARWEQAR